MSGSQSPGRHGVCCLVGGHLMVGLSWVFCLDLLVARPRLPVSSDCLLLFVAICGGSCEGEHGDAAHDSFLFMLERWIAG